MMTRFTVHASTPLPPAAALARLLDLDRHRAPLTDISWQPPLVAGSRIVARTHLGRLGFDDVMVVHEIGETHARLEKVGRVVRGSSTIDVTPCGEGSRVTWRQELGVPALPETLVRAAGRLFYQSLVRRALR